MPPEIAVEGNEEEFDLDSAVSDIAGSLGFGEGETEDKKPEAPVKPAVVEAVEKVEEPKDPVIVEPKVSNAPKSWKKEVLVDWDKVPANVQSEILRREEDFHKGLEVYKENAGFGNTIREAINPYLPIMQQYGIDPVENIKSLMGAHYQLATGNNQQKLALFQKLAQDYRVDLSELGMQEPLAPVDPRLEALNVQVQQTNAKLASFEQERIANQRTAVMNEIQTFASDPANPFFEEVANDITALIKSGVASNLKEAYEKAVWTNPITRQKEIDRLNEAKKKEIAAKVVSAKKAISVNVRPAPKSQSVTAPKGSMDDTLNEAYERIMNGA